MTKSGKQQSPRKHRWLWRTIFALGVLLGLALVFNEPIKLFVVDHLSQWTMGQIDRNTVDKNEKRSATFDFKGVKALDINTVGNAACVSRPLYDQPRDSFFTFEKCPNWRYSRDYEYEESLHLQSDHETDC